MNLFKQKKWNFALNLALAAFFVGGVCSPLAAGPVSHSKKDVKEYLKKAPWLGLVVDKITYGPITLSKICINDGDKLVFASPGQVLEGSLHYSIKAKDLDAMHRHHLIIGIKGEGAQECVTHNMGLWNSKGDASISLTAPMEKGFYEVRFFLVEEFSCKTAQDVWNSGKDAPNSDTTIGIIIVE